MNLFICPISKTGERKVGFKINDSSLRLISSLKKHFDGFFFTNAPFVDFFNFLDSWNFDLELAGKNVTVELTDGYDVQERNYYIDYTKDPVKLLCEDKDGFPIEDKETSGRKKLTYKKTTGEIKTYIVEKVIERSQYELKVVIEGGGFRNFKVDKILAEEDI